MNGIHDLGGMDGFGPVERETNEPVFHAPWEGRVRGIWQTTIKQRLYNLDEFRDAIERMEPVHYLRSSYYEKWITAIETKLVEKGVLGRADIDRAAEGGTQAGNDPPDRRPGDPALTAFLLERAPARDPRADMPAPRFAVGDEVVARNLNPTGHIRLPRYVRGRRGTIAMIHGAFPLPDTMARGLPPAPEPLYSVRFTGAELWGDAAEPGQTLHIDLSESYLDAAAEGASA